MKKAKPSNYGKIEKHQRKMAEENSRNARAAMRELYTDAIFERDFTAMVAATKERLLGKEKVEHMAVIRYFPDKSTTVSFPPMDMHSPGRRSIYQELGIDIGTHGFQVVSLYSWEVITTDPDERVLVSGISIDGRKRHKYFRLVRDSMGVIQNTLDTDPDQDRSTPPEIDIEHESFITGYSYGLRDNMLAKMMVGVDESK